MIARVGQKAHNLARLVRCELGTPPFLVLPADGAADPMIHGVPIHENLHTQLLGLSATEQTTWAVRSSAIMYDSQNRLYSEDNAKFSTAGWFRTELNVPYKDLPRAIDSVRRAVRAPHVQKLASHFGVDPTRIETAIILQPFLVAQASAVVFLKSPFPAQLGSILICGCFGACIGLVHGQITGDQIWINRASGQISRVTVTKPIEFTSEPNGGLCEQDVEFGRQNEPALLEDDVRSIQRLVSQIEAEFGNDQVLELVKSREIWIPVQCRPAPPARTG